MSFQEEPLPEADDSDIVHGGIAPLLPKIARTLKADERTRVAYLYARGGRFEDASEHFIDEKLKYQWTKTLCVYNESIGTSIDTTNGLPNSGMPCHKLPQLANKQPMCEVFSEQDWPLLAFSFKSNLMNSYA